MEKRATARKDFDHYRTKVGSLETQKAAQDKLQRNHKKYDVATDELNALVKDEHSQQHTDQSRPWLGPRRLNIMYTLAVVDFLPFL
eukprot:1677706-Amphidinium_carterae.1